jgi:hypothetical protein
MVVVPQIRGLTIVLIGDFNPTIFQPAWFAAQGFITDEEARTAAIGIIHPDVTAFELSWLKLQVDRERFFSMCLAPPYFPQVVETVCRTFELLHHTPIKALGITNEAHYRSATIDKWHTLGNKLAPKEDWLPFFKQPGMRTLRIEQNPRPDGEEGHVQVTVEPSLRINPGLYLNVNDEIHGKGGAPLGAKLAVEKIQQRWPETTEFSEKIFEHFATQIIA